MTTTVADVATWIHALADGRLLTARQHQAMMAPSTAGLGPLTKDKYFAYGVAHAGDWIFMNPAYGGYHGVVYYDTRTKTLVIAYVTLGPKSDAATDDALPLGKEIATLLVPDRPPQIRLTGVRMFTSWSVLAIASVLGLLAPCASSVNAADSAKADAIMRILRDYMAEAHLKAVIVRVTVDGKEIVTAAEGESMTGVPATTDMHFRNGAVAIAYVATLLLELVDEKKISLDDKLSKYLPRPAARRRDHDPRARPDDLRLPGLRAGQRGVRDDRLRGSVQGLDDRRSARSRDPQTALVRAGHELELRAHQLRDPRSRHREGHRPEDRRPAAGEGARSSRAHKHHNAEPHRGDPRAGAARLHLRAPRASSTSPPVRRSTKSRPTGTRRGPSPTVPSRRSNIYDLEKTAVAIGTGKLISTQSFRLMTIHRSAGPHQRRTRAAETAALSTTSPPTVSALDIGGLVLPEPLVLRIRSRERVPAAQKIAIAVAVTYLPGAFNNEGQYSNGANALFRKIGAYLAPNDAPPTRPGG